MMIKAGDTVRWVRFRGPHNIRESFSFDVLVLSDPYLRAGGFFFEGRVTRAGSNAVYSVGYKSNTWYADRDSWQIL